MARSELLGTIYQRVLRDQFDLLAPVLNRFLGDAHGGRASGRLSVTRTAGRLRNLAAAALRIPPHGDYDLVLEVLPHAGGQRWVRRFGAYTLETTQVECKGLRIESSGAASLGFELAIHGGALIFRPRRAWVFGIRLPLCLAPTIEAENWPTESGGWRVRVRFCVPLLGFLGKYEGDVMPE